VQLQAEDHTLLPAIGREADFNYSLRYLIGLLQSLGIRERECV
jgi:hypothetical protein